MNVDLKGRAKAIVHTMVEEGFANTQSEAIRLAVISFGEKHLSEEEIINKKLDLIDKQINEGKRKLLTPKQALGNYAKYLD